MLKQDAQVDELDPWAVEPRHRAALHLLLPRVRRRGTGRGHVLPLVERFDIEPFSDYSAK